MKLIYITPNPSGAYSAIQEVDFGLIPDGMAIWPAELETDTFYQYNGFVTLTVENVSVPALEDGQENNLPTVTAYTPNVEAWEAWKASLPPEPESTPKVPTEDEDRDTMLVDHEFRLTLLELGLSDTEI